MALQEQPTLEHVFEQFPDGIILSDAAGNVVYINHLALNILGTNEEELLQKNAISTLFSEEEKAFFAHYNHQNKVELYHTWHHHQSGEQQWLKIKITNRHSPDQEFAGRMFVISEATAYKRLEDEHNRLVGELEKTKKSWADFAYIISHDLKAPLRAISTLSEWIHEDYADKIDDMGKEQLQLLNNRVQRMHDLIEGVLQYSRIGRSKKTPSTFSLCSIIKQSLNDLKIPESIAIEIPDQLPKLVADEMRIYQLFFHLFKNAIDFNDKTEKWIRLGMEKENEHFKFHIADNGIGIAPKYHQEVFAIFRTLDIIQKKENIGIGLPLAKKIVELYGGKIWLESATNIGTTVYFTLPLTLEKAQKKKHTYNSDDI